MVCMFIENNILFFNCHTGLAEIHLILLNLILGSNCGDAPVIQDTDVEMVSAEDIQNGHSNTCNGKSISCNVYQNGNSHNANNPCQDVIWNDIEDEDMGKLITSINFFKFILNS